MTPRKATYEPNTVHASTDVLDEPDADEAVVVDEGLEVGESPYHALRKLRDVPPPN